MLYLHPASVYRSWHGLLAVIHLYSWVLLPPSLPPSLPPCSCLPLPLAANMQLNPTSCVSQSPYREALAPGLRWSAGPSLPSSPLAPPAFNRPVSSVRCREAARFSPPIVGLAESIGDRLHNRFDQWTPFWNFPDADSGTRQWYQPSRHSKGYRSKFAKSRRCFVSPTLCWWFLILVYAKQKNIYCNKIICT